MQNHLSQKQSDRKNRKEQSRKGQRTREPAPLPRGIPMQAEGELSASVPEGLKVVLTREAFAQLFGYAYATGLEISCLGTVIREGQSFKITRFYLLKQTGSEGHTHVHAEAIAELAEGLLSEAKPDEARSIRAWAHSHPGGGLFWSETDEETCRTLVSSDYLVSLVIGKDFSVRCRIDLAGPVPLTLDHVPVLYEIGIDKAVLTACQKEVQEKLSPEPLLSALTAHTADEQLLLPADAEAYCELCGNWHPEGGCPVETADYAGFEDWYGHEGPSQFPLFPEKEANDDYREEQECE